MIKKNKDINRNNDILLIFLLSKSARNKTKNTDKIKKIECLFSEKVSSTEKESIIPVIPSDNIKKKFILSTDVHQ